MTAMNRFEFDQRKWHVSYSINSAIEYFGYSTIITETNYLLNIAIRGIASLRTCYSLNKYVFRGYLGHNVHTYHGISSLGVPVHTIWDPMARGSVRA